MPSTCSSTGKGDAALPNTFLKLRVGDQRFPSPEWEPPKQLEHEYAKSARGARTESSTSSGVDAETASCPGKAEKADLQNQSGSPSTAADLASPELAPSNKPSTPSASSSDESSDHGPKGAAAGFPEVASRHDDSDEADETLGLTCWGMNWTHPSEYKRSRFDETTVYKEHGVLGVGGNGKCLLLERTVDSKFVVCKISRRDELVPRELKVLAEILPRSDRIVELVGHTFSPLHYQIYTMYCDGGNLDHLVEHYSCRQRQVPESFMWHAFKQLAEALSFIHFSYYHKFDLQQNLPPTWQPVIHGDMKPLNVFLRLRPSANKYPDLVLGDFGNSVFGEDEDLVGTPPWCPPESPRCTTKADVWGMGAIIHAMANFGEPPVLPLPPFVDPTFENYDRWVLWGGSHKPLAPWSYSSELGMCMNSALQTVFERRLDSIQILRRIIAIHDVQGIGKEPRIPLDAGWETTI